MAAKKKAAKDSESAKYGAMAKELDQILAGEAPSEALPEPPPEPLVKPVTTAAFADAIAAFQTGKAQRRLSRAALEALSIIAYRQPVTRAEVEAIRGVACGEVLRSLLERRLIAITGRAEEVGRPMLYGTSKRFLEVFGIAGIRDLPAPEGFKPRRPPLQTSASETESDASDSVSTVQESEPIGDEPEPGPGPTDP